MTSAVGIAAPTIKRSPPHSNDEPYAPVLRWLIFTGLCFFAATLAWRYGLIRTMVSADRTRISSVIALLYLGASAHVLWRCIVIAREASAAMGLAKQPSESPVIYGQNSPRTLVSQHVRDVAAMARAAEAELPDQALLLRGLSARLAAPARFTALASDTLMKLGLLGTIIGFIMMLAPLSGLDSANPDALKAAMSVMSDGMAAAMYTTLAGLIGSVLLQAQAVIADAATVKLFADVVRLTEVRLIPALGRPHV